MSTDTGELGSKSVFASRVTWSTRLALSGNP